LFEGTILENILIGDETENYNKNKLDFCLEISNLKNFIKNLPKKENTNIGSNNKNLSGGQQKKIHIARGFYRFSNDKSLIILDEPFENLDEKSKNIFLKHIKNFKEKFTIILISHNKKDLKICDKIFNLETKHF